MNIINTKSHMRFSFFTSKNTKYPSAGFSFFHTFLNFL
jgi:hypothetical protein